MYSRWQLVMVDCARALFFLQNPCSVCCVLRMSCYKTSVLSVMSYVCSKTTEYRTFIITCRWCTGVMKSLCMSCALLCQEGCPYLTSRCRQVDVSIDGHTLRLSVFVLEGCHIPRVLSLVTSETLVLGLSDKNNY